MTATKTAKPAAKRPAKTKTPEQNKLLATAVKKTVNRNTVLPILEDIFFLPGFAEVSDLENVVRIPFNLPGVPDTGTCLESKLFLDTLDMIPEPSVSIGKDNKATIAGTSRKITMTPEDPANFPINLAFNKQRKRVPLGNISLEDVGKLETALSFVSTDDLRPAMTGVYFESVVTGAEKSASIAATDAHRLYFDKLSGPLEQSFIMPAKTAKIVLALGGSWEIFGLGLTDLTDEYFLWLALVREDGTTVTFRAIDARFPDYRVVIPEGKGMVNMEIDKDILLTELKNAGKFANTSTNQVTFSMNGKLRISSADIDFDREYKVDILCGEEMNLKFSKKYTDQWLYEGKPVTITQDLGEFVQITGRDVVVPKTELIQQGAEFHIGFNYRFLQEVAHKVPIGEKVRFKMWAPTKAAIINDNFLVMPLMINI